MGREGPFAPRLLCVSVGGEKRSQSVFLRDKVKIVSNSWVGRTAKSLSNPEEVIVFVRPLLPNCVATSSRGSLFSQNLLQVRPNAGGITGFSSG